MRSPNEAGQGLSSQPLAEPKRRLVLAANFAHAAMATELFTKTASASFAALLKVNSSGCFCLINGSDRLNLCRRVIDTSVAGLHSDG